MSLGMVIGDVAFAHWLPIAISRVARDRAVVVLPDRGADMGAGGDG